MLKKLIRLNRRDFGLCGIIAGIFVVVHIAAAVALGVFGEQTSLLLSGVLLPVTAGILILIYAISQIMVTFVQAVQFGQTRRRALGLSMGVLAVQSAAAMGLAAVLAALERRIAPVLWLRLTGAEALVRGIGGRRVPVGIVLEPSNTLFIEVFDMVWWGWPAIALGAAALGILIAAVLLRFGGKGGWTLWALWMGGLLVINHLPWRTYTIVDWLVPALVILVVAGLAWSLWCLLHIAVKG